MIWGIGRRNKGPRLENSREDKSLSLGEWRKGLLLKDYKMCTQYKSKTVFNDTHFFLMEPNLHGLITCGSFHFLLESSWPVFLSLSNCSIKFQGLKKRTIHLEPLPLPNVPWHITHKLIILGKKRGRELTTLKKLDRVWHFYNKNWIKEFTITTLVLLLIRPWP